MQCVEEDVEPVPKEQQKWMVGIKYDRTVVMYCSGDPDVQKEFINLDVTGDLFFRFMVADSEESAKQIASHLRGSDLSEFVPDAADQRRAHEFHVQLGEDQADLTSFTDAMSNDSAPPVFLVVYDESRQAHMFSSKDDDAFEKYVALFAGDDRKKLRGWKKFTSSVPATEFFEGLSFISKKGASPTPSLVHPPQIQANSFNSPTRENLMGSFNNASPSSSVTFGANVGGSGGVGNSGMSSPSASSFRSGSRAPPALEGGGVDLRGLKYSLSGGKGRGGSGFTIKVSPAIPHKSGVTSFAVMLFIRPGSMWHFAAPVLAAPIDAYVEHLKSQGQDVAVWMTNISDCPLPNAKDPKKFSRNNKGYVTNMPRIVFEVNKLVSIDTHVNRILNTLGSNFTPENTELGSEYANWLKENKPGVYDSETGETGTKKKISHEEFVATIQSRLVKLFASKQLEWNAPMDTLMTHGHIKEFLIKFCGYNHWNELPQDCKKKLLYKPMNPYPDWDSTEVPSYNGRD